MVAFKTSSERLPAWVRVAWLFYFDYLSEMDAFQIEQAHDPSHWSKDETHSQLKSINIHVMTSGEAEAEIDNTLLHKITIYTVHKK